MPETLDIETTDGIATVTMHRGGNNAIASDLAGDLKAAFEQLAVDARVRVVVLRSAYEKYFSVGADLGSLAQVDRDAPDAVDQVMARVRPFLEAFAAIEGCPKPVIAAINGHALGGGCEMVLACDYRIMVDDGRSLIGQTEVALGIIPGAGGTQRLPRLIGKARALPLMLEGTRLSAKQAEAIGLVNQAVTPEDLDGVVKELASRLAKAATLALGLVKDAVNRGLGQPLEEGLGIESENFARACLSQDAVIGLMAFFAKQAPEFTGS